MALVAIVFAGCSASFGEKLVFFSVVSKCCIVLGESGIGSHLIPSSEHTGYEKDSYMYKEEQYRTLVA